MWDWNQYWSVLYGEPQLRNQQFYYWMAPFNTHSLKLRLGKLNTNNFSEYMRGENIDDGDIITGVLNKYGFQVKVAQPKNPIMTHNGHAFIEVIRVSVHNYSIFATPVETDDTGWWHIVQPGSGMWIHLGEKGILDYTCPEFLNDANETRYAQNEFGKFSTRCKMNWCTPESCPRHKMGKAELHAYFTTYDSPKRNEYRFSDPPHALTFRNDFDISLTYWPYGMKGWDMSGMKILIDYRLQNISSKSYNNGIKIACVSNHMYYVFANKMERCVCRSNHHVLNCKQLYEIQSVAERYAPGGQCSGSTHLICRRQEGNLHLDVTHLSYTGIVKIANAHKCGSDSYVPWPPRRLC